MAKRHVVKIGDLKHRITFQSNTKVSDNQGGMVKTWTDLITVWASIEPISERERIYTQAMQYRRSHKIFLRYSATTSTLNTEMRVAFGDRTFQIKAIIVPDEDNWFIQLDCEENVGS